MCGRHTQAGSGLLVLALGVVILAILAWAGLQVAGRIAQLSRAHQPAATSSILRGVSLSPAAYDASGLSAFFAKVGTLPGAALEWQGDWAELGRPNTGASLVLANADKYHYAPLLVVSAFSDGGKSRLVPIRPLTSSQTDMYVTLATSFVRTYKPTYFGVGIEVNRIHETSVESYQTFVQLFHRTVTAVHAASPDTKVFTTFQLERLKGLRGGLFGGTNDDSQNDWALLHDFDDADLLGFTSYPAVIYHVPSDLPARYYAEIADHTSKPVAFTELGWPAADEATGWPSTPTLQQQYLTAFWAQITKLPMRFTVWSFLYDQPTTPPFNHLGLMNSDGSARPGWPTFRDH